MIECSNIRFIYHNQINEQISIDHFVIEKGKCVVLCGKSGSGKTSITRLINGLIPEYYEGDLSGQIRVEDFCPGKDGIEDLARVVGSVFQNPATQFFHKTVEHELVFPCENQGITPIEIHERLNQTVNVFNLDKILQMNLHHASGGERQRVAMATAMMQKPLVIVLDEPTANLDREGVEQVLTYLKQLKLQGITIVIAEHRTDFLRDIADYYVYIDDGKIVYQWSPDEWFSLNQEKRAKLGLRGVVTNQRQKMTNCLSTGGLEVRDLTLKVGKKQLGKIKTAFFPTSCITALVGKNGIGKSSLARVLSGLDSENGRILMNQKQIDGHSRLQQTAFVMQEVRLQLFSETVEKEIKLGLTSENIDLYAEIIEKLELTSLLGRHPMSLSGGQMQRVMIAHALLSNKKIFIFDEPTSGLDYIQMMRFSELLQSLKSNDVVIIVITHDLELIEVACDHIVDLETIFV